MTLARRINAMEAEIRALRGTVQELSQWKASVEAALEAEEADEEQPTTTLDGDHVEAGERDQTQSLG